MKRKHELFPLAGDTGMSCYHRVGDMISVPIKLQIIKVFTHEDFVYYAAVPVDNPKRMVTLPGPAFVVNTEYDADDKLPDMPMEMLIRADQFIKSLHGEEDTEDESGEEE